MIRIRHLVPIVLLVSQANAIAQDQPDLIVQKFSEVVSYDDLDLTSAEGIEALDHRIYGAVNRVCRKANPDDVRTSMLMRVCRREAYQGAREQRDRALAARGADERIRVAIRTR